MKKYKMLVTDFDGTLYRSDHTIADDTVKAIKKFVSEGGKFIVCTGRMAQSIRPILYNLGLVGDVLCLQGAILCDIESGKIKSEGGIDWQRGATLLKDLEGEGEHLQTYISDDMYTARRDIYTEFYEKGCNITANITGIPLSEYVANGKKRINKVVSLGEPHKMRKLYEKYKDYGNGIIVNMSEPTFLEAVDMRYSKGESMKRIAAEYGVGIDEVIAVGDSLNDMTLIESAGLGVAVANADEELKRAADEVTVSNDQDAVKALLEKYCIGE